jgi:phosphoribosylformylglycinamidine cyclo-ligase
MVATYKEAGVDIEKGDALVDKIKTKVKSTYGREVVSGVGGFACLYEIDNDRYLSAGADGVGTKLLIAQELNRHDTIGIDLVAMCVNDIVCTGARPMFFMDYLASGELDLDVSSQIIDGIVEGCKLSSCALIGGETAEMPGLYKSGEYDLAGFAVGEVYKDKVLNGSVVKSGDKIIGFPSSGFHSNGYSLLRKVFKDDKELLNRLLTPTRIYVNEVLSLVSDNLISGAAHITGGGIHNVARINKSFDYQISNWPDLRGTVFEELINLSSISKEELHRTFNMGIGMCVTTGHPENILNQFPEAIILGEVVSGDGKVQMNTL